MEKSTIISRLTAFLMFLTIIFAGCPAYSAPAFAESEHTYTAPTDLKWSNEYGRTYMTFMVQDDTEGKCQINLYKDGNIVRSMYFNNTMCKAGEIARINLDGLGWIQASGKYTFDIEVGSEIATNDDGSIKSQKIITDEIGISMDHYELDDCVSSKMSDVFDYNIDQRTKLNAPTNVTFNVNTKELKWKKVEGASAYGIMGFMGGRPMNPPGGLVFLVSGNQFSYDSVNETYSYKYTGTIDASEEYEFRVRAITPDLYNNANSDYSEASQIETGSGTEIIEPSEEEFELCGRTYLHNLDYYAENLNTSKFDNDLCSLMAAIVTSSGDSNGLETMYSALGFTKFEHIERNYKDPTFFVEIRDGITYTIGIKTNREGKRVVLISIHGTGNTSDIVHDLTVSKLDDDNYTYHEGFQIAANVIYSDLKNYLGGEPGTDKNTKYFVTGHSLGGAAGNLLGAELSRMVGKDSVFCYTFASPNTVTSTESILDNPDAFNESNGNSNIFNICRATDRVPSLPGLESSMLLETKEYAHYGWDLFQCFHTKHDYYWGKLGITKWFNDGYLSLVDAHDMGNYLDYVSSEKPQYTITPTYGDNYTYVMNNIFILCPVDAEVIGDDGEVVAAVINNKPKYYGNESESVYIAVSEDEKCISYPSDKNYKIRLKGTDNGSMTYVVAQGSANDEEYNNIKVYSNINLTAEKEMLGAINNNEIDKSELFVVDEKDNIIAVIQEDGTETKPIEPAHQHSFSAWTTTVPATEVAAGVQTRTCTGCGISETQAIAQLAPSLPAVKISKPTAAKKKITVKWKKVSKANLKKIDGIQIQVATDPAFTKIVKTVTAGKKKTSRAIKGLQPKTKYYVRIRAYAAGEHVSDWKVKSIKVK